MLNLVGEYSDMISFIKVLNGAKCEEVIYIFWKVY